MKIKRIVPFDLLLSVLLLSVLTSCSNTWLEAKPDKSIVVPGTLDDYQALLDNTGQNFNFYQSAGLGEIAAGDFYITYPSYNSLFSVQEKSAYTWAPTPKFYGDDVSSDWQGAYGRILKSNLILNGIEKVKATDVQFLQWKNVKGSALFYRALDYFDLSQEFCKAYASGTAGSDLGLPLRTDYDFNIQLKRSNLQDVYKLILGDLKVASTLLDATPLVKTRPSKQAAFALLARIYLSMEHYEEAGQFADSALRIQSGLLDYAMLNASAAYPLQRFNSEIIFHNSFSYGAFNASRLIVQPALYELYEANDYRRSMFYKPAVEGMTYKGSYAGDKNLFGGLATDELYLIRAECAVRKGDVESAQEDLHLILSKRIKGYTAVGLVNDQDKLLLQVLTERRKELPFRGLRWSDLRRLNRDPRYAVTLTRTLNGKTYTLMPGDKRYVFPIDDHEIRLGGLEQNVRE